MLSERYKLWNFSSWSLFHSSFSVFLGPNIRLRILFPNTLRLHYSLDLRDHVSQLYSTTVNIYIYIYLNFHNCAGYRNRDLLNSRQKRYNWAKQPDHWAHKDKYLIPEVYFNLLDLICSPLLYDVIIVVIIDTVSFWNMIVNCMQPTFSV